MRTITPAVFVAFVALMAGLAIAQDKRPECCRKGTPLPWSNYNRGVRWMHPMKDALEKARKDHRLAMVFHLVGNLDKMGC